MSESDIINFQKKDPFAEIDEETGDVVGNANYVHIRVMQRTAKKRLTTCEGLPQKLNFDKLLRALRKQLCCNGCLITDKDLGNVIQLQGDHRQGVFNFLTESGLVKPDMIKIHGII